MNTIISISGSSGVGKTTLSRMISLVVGLDNVVHLCGDDLHLWERGDVNWEKHTHLNPEANDLKRGVDDLTSLRNGKKIQRQKYNHDTGKFDPPAEVDPKSIIIYEGLHTLCADSAELSDIKIFVETDKKLKRQWKINRDTQKRGYTVEQVEDVLRRREQDELLYIQPQKENADAVIRFEEKRDRTVHLEYTANTKESLALLERVKKMYDMHREFLLLCKKTSFEYDLVQHGGGNVSYKFEDKMIITSSGRDMSEVFMLSGFSVCDLSGVSIDNQRERPSMEVGFHSKINHPVVFHTHPIYLNTILCSNESEEIMSEILYEYDYDYVSYVTPGEDLSATLNQENVIILLENHGLICSGSSFIEVFDTSMRINQLCKEWLIRNSTTFKTFSCDTTNRDDGYLFPDAIVLKDKMQNINQYMLYIQSGVGLTPRLLPTSEVEKLLNMESEKYRMSLV
tara:strand:- start:439 stop:1800 length:1362 start_codon:yes stop_codon:yes gene_type:complete